MSTAFIEPERWDNVLPFRRLSLVRKGMHYTKMDKILLNNLRIVSQKKPDYA